MIFQAGACPSRSRAWLSGAVGASGGSVEQDVAVARAAAISFVDAAGDPGAISSAAAEGCKGHARGNDVVMMQRTGSANLPLHGGREPAWLSARMSALGRVIAEAIVHHYGRQALRPALASALLVSIVIRRCCRYGLRHSSGITTSVIGAEMWLEPCANGARHFRLRRPRLAFAAHSR